MRLYLAGPSKELPRIIAIRDALQAAGHTITSRWIDIILAEGSEHVVDISEERLKECAAINEADIIESEMMVYVVEHHNGKSVGAGYELGFQARVLRDRIVVLEQPYWDPAASRDDAKQHAPKPTLFALSLHRVDSMDKLLAYLEGWESSAREYDRAFPCSDR